MRRCHYFVSLMNPTRKGKNRKNKTNKQLIMNTVNFTHKNNGIENLHSKKKQKGNSSSSLIIVRTKLKLSNEKRMDSLFKIKKVKTSKQKNDTLNLNQKVRQNKKNKIYTKNQTINTAVLFDNKVKKKIH